jgi:hypothetical protein
LDPEAGNRPFNCDRISRRHSAIDYDACNRARRQHRFDLSRPIEEFRCIEWERSGGIAIHGTQLFGKRAR